MQASAASLAAAQAIAEALKAADRGLGVIQQFGPLDGLQRWIGAFEHVSQLIDGSKQIKTRILPAGVQTFTDGTAAALGQLGQELSMQHRSGRGAPY